ncbi:MAG TPA: hypothetical protein VJ826_16425 [Candidatus Polarisedimenticolaceae bacterium]|nr:hypothetical protein [Candidatus Polarisedimenticolaceae bacterium]
MQTTCRFTTKTSLTWDPVAGATQYNVYRGPLTNLVDANLDHLPDGGYGTCQNARDANLTDTAFADADVPTVAQKGFFYLVARRSRVSNRAWAPTASELRGPWPRPAPDTKKPAP